MDPLNSNELEVLRLLWEESPRKPAELQSSFGWEIDNGTLRSVLVGMVERGLLRRERQGKAYFYRPRVRRETQLRKMAKGLAELFTGGSTERLLMELAASEELSPDDVAKLTEAAEEKKPER